MILCMTEEITELHGGSFSGPKTVAELQAFKNGYSVGELTFWDVSRHIAKNCPGEVLGH